MDSQLLFELNKSRARREPVAIVTSIEGGEKQLVRRGQLTGHELEKEIVQRFRSGKSGMIETPHGEKFIQVYVPSPKLLIIGAVHISQALYPMAQACGFEVTIVDPRSAFATADRFADVELHDDWPEEIWDDLKVDGYTALAAVTHDPKIDDYALKSALDLDCFYVGALGSRKTHAKRCARLLEMGASQSQIDRIASPIGLDIGAANPAEIAVAVMAQIVHYLRKHDDFGGNGS